ncbi:hypothetical protein J6590_074572 [Homalodisca vitripennis]|nr:hypothetical protein J6590_074572 [Homalodisca vitripennis]
MERLCGGVLVVWKGLTEGRWCPTVVPDASTRVTGGEESLCSVRCCVTQVTSAHYKRRVSHERSGITPSDKGKTKRLGLQPVHFLDVTLVTGDDAEIESQGTRRDGRSQPRGRQTGGAHTVWDTVPWNRYCNSRTCFRHAGSSYFLPEPLMGN